MGSVFFCTCLYIYIIYIYWLLALCFQRIPTYVSQSISLALFVLFWFFVSILHYYYFDFCFLKRSKRGRILMTAKICRILLELGEGNHYKNIIYSYSYIYIQWKKVKRYYKLNKVVVEEEEDEEEEEEKEEDVYRETCKPQSPSIQRVVTFSNSMCKSDWKLAWQRSMEINL